MPAMGLHVNNTVRAQFEALLLEPLMRPLESAFGQYGEIVTQSFGEMLARELAHDARA
jgi:hypothetical protein